MRIFVYEQITAFGLHNAEHSLFREGQAMRNSLMEDLKLIPGTEVATVTADWSIDSNKWARHAIVDFDYQIVISPYMPGELQLLETAAILSNRIQTFRPGGSFVGPPPDVVRLISDKLSLADHWRNAGVPSPATTDREPTACDAFPLIWKPQFGAGSVCTFLLESAFDIKRCERFCNDENSGSMILQQFVAGQAASVAFLTGPGVAVPLLPAFQHLSADGRFKYLGGESPIPAHLAERAVRLGIQAISCIPELRGWIGVDMILGDADDGSRDYAIEINPRLTTSYIGLRKLAKTNLAEAMLKAALGEPMEIQWRKERVHFESDGRVRVYPL